MILLSESRKPLLPTNPILNSTQAGTLLTRIECERNYFKCSLCDKKYYVEIKRSCTEGCQDKKAEMLKFVDGKAVVPKAAQVTIFNNHRMPIAPPPVSSSSTNAKTSAQAKTAILIQQRKERPENQSLIGATSLSIPVHQIAPTIEQTPQVIHAQNEYGDGSSQVEPKHVSGTGNREYYCKLPTDRVIVETCFPLPYNPSGHANISKIYDIFIESHKLLTGGPYKWIEINADVGATYFQALEKTGVLRYHHPGLHESFAMDHAVMKMLWEAGFDTLAFFIGFKSDKAVSFFMLGTLTHVVREFKRLARRILGKLLYNAYRMDEKNSLDKVNTMPPEDLFYAWRHSPRVLTDKHLTNLVDLYDLVLAPDTIYLNGYRYCQKSVSEGGRKVLFPLFGPLNYLSYFKAIIRDFYEEWRWKPLYRKHRKKFFSIGKELGSCQSIDAIQEQDVAGLLASGMRNNKNGPAVAALLMETHKDLTDAAFKQSGRKNPTKYHRVSLCCF